MIKFDNLILNINYHIVNNLSDIHNLDLKDGDFIFNQCDTCLYFYDNKMLHKANLKRNISQIKKNRIEKLKNILNI